MATLRQTLRGLSKPQPELVRGPGGILQEKTLQEATRQAGLASAPVTPMAAQMTGASPQAAKMAGTPQQLKSALEQATAPQPADLQTTLRRKQVRAEALAPEQQKISKSADMQALGGLGDRVTNFIDTEMKKLTAAVPVQVQAVTEYLGKPLEPISEKLAALRANPADQTAQLAVAEYFGRALEPKEINELYEQMPESVARAAAQTVADVGDLNVGALVPELGYNIDSLSALLNVPAEELSKYSVKQLQDKINQVQTEEFTQAQKMQELAAAPERGQAERMLAREAGRELSAVGIRATEADMQRLSQEIGSANIISFGGQQVRAEDVLADDNISAIIKDYLESPEGSEIRKELDQAEPELSSFIKRNAAALKEVASKIETGATEFKRIQEANKKFVLDSFGGIELLPEVAAAIVPKATKLSATEITAADSPILTHLQDKTPDEKRAFADQVNAEVSKNPSVAKEISQLSPEDLKSLNIENNGKRWRTFKDISQDYREVTNLEPDEYEQILANYSPNLYSPEQVNSDIETNNIMTNLGFGDNQYTTGTLPIKEGKLDADSLKTTFIANNPTPKISEAVSGTAKSGAFSYKAPTIPDTDSAQGRVLRSWSDFGKSGKTPTPNEVSDRLFKLVTNSGMYREVPVTGFLEPSQELLDKKYEAQVSNWEQTEKFINDLKTSGTWYKWGFTDEDAANLNRAPIREKAFKVDVDFDIGNIPGFDIRI